MPSESGTSESGYRIDTAEVADFVADLRSFVRLIQDRMADADAVVSGLATTWSGDAAAAHADAHKRWVDGAGHMRDAIDDIGAATDRSRAVFTEVQDLHRRMWP